MRILLENSEYVAVGFRVPVAKMMRAQQLARALRIPPAAIDVLSSDFDAGEVTRRVQAHGSEEIADVLLHQEVMAGVGNEFKSEICFVLGVNPFCRVKELRPGEIEALIAASVRLVKANVLEDSGETRVTYGGMHRRTTGRIDPRERVWVYGRGDEPCRKCGEPICRRLQGRDARVTFWCPKCQGAGVGGL
jgi:endonuclease-8